MQPPHVAGSMLRKLFKASSYVQVDLVQCDIASLEGQERLEADTVIMNPPFGTRVKGADMDFLRAGFKAWPSAFQHIS